MYNQDKNILNYDLSTESSENHALGDGHLHSIAEYFDPLGYSVWIYMRGEINHMTSQYLVISILLGISTTVAL